MSYYAIQKNIRDLFNNKIYIIPRNQRKYVWTKDNWQDLFSDILFSIENDNHHFIGSVVLLKDDSDSRLSQYEVIDGQQRVMTLTIFMVAILFFFRKYGMNDLFKGSKKYIVFNDDENKEHHIFNSPYQRSLSNMIDDVLKLEPKFKTTVDVFLNRNIIDERNDKNIGNCFSFLANQIDEYCAKGKKKQKLIALKDKLLDMEFVRIDADSTEDSYTIFEILNARGQKLADYEMIKNYVMRYITPQNKVDAMRLEWDNMEKSLGKGMKNFFKHYLIHKYALSDDDKKDAYKALKRFVKPNDVKDAFKDIQKKSKYYSRIYNPQLEDGDGNRICSDLEYEVFSYFKLKKQEQFRPLILSLMNVLENEEININKYNSVLIFLKNFFVCYTLIGKEKSNTLTSLIAKNAKDLENNYSEDLLTSIVESFKSRIPSEKFFKNAFVNIGFSNHTKYYSDEKEKERAKLVLEYYEQSLTKNKNLPDFTIEHILPDSKGEENANIGNLLPLESSLNEKCKDKKLSEKILFYKQSSFKSVQQFAKRYESNPNLFDVEKRRTYLANEFYKLLISSNDK